MTGLGLTLPACLLLLLAHRAFCAVLIFLRAAAETARRGLAVKRPPFNLPRTESVASTRLSWSTSFTLSVFNCETKDAKPLRFAIALLSGKDVSRIVENWTATLLPPTGQGYSGLSSPQPDRPRYRQQFRSCRNFWNCVQLLRHTEQVPTPKGPFDPSRNCGKVKG